MLFNRFAFFLFLISFLLQSATCAADDWTQFRGSDNTGIAANSQPPVKWDLAQDVKWATEIPGVGWSSPVFADGRVWLTSAITTEASPEAIQKKLAGDPLAGIKTVANSVDLIAVCVDLMTGQMIHNITLAEIDNPEVINPMNSYASPTPAMSNGLIVCHFGSYGTWCLDSKTGEQRWHKKYVIDHSVGPGSSPVIYNGKVILVCDGADKQYIAAVNLKNGDEIWRTDRPAIRAVNGEQQKAYCTPMIVEINGAAQAIIPGAQWIAGYEPNSGIEIWRADHGDGFSVTPMALMESGLIIFSTGYTRPELVAVDPSGSGDVSKTHIKWRARNAPTMPSLIGSSGYVYAIMDNGILHCFDAKTGEEAEAKRVGGNFSASPLLADGKLYLSSREGIVSVFTCDKKLEKVATNRFDSSILASPAVIDNDLIVRTEKKLFRITNRSKSASEKSK